MAYPINIVGGPNQRAFHNFTNVLLDDANHEDYLFFTIISQDGRELRLGTQHDGTPSYQCTGKLVNIGKAHERPKNLSGPSVLTLTIEIIHEKQQFFIMTTFDYRTGAGAGWLFGGQEFYQYMPFAEGIREPLTTNGFSPPVKRDNYTEWFLPPKESEKPKNYSLNRAWNKPKPLMSRLVVPSSKAT